MYGLGILHSDRGGLNGQIILNTATDGPEAKAWYSKDVLAGDLGGSHDGCG